MVPGGAVARLHFTRMGGRAVRARGRACGSLRVTVTVPLPGQPMHPSASVAQWIRRLTTDQEILGSTPSGGNLLLLRCPFSLAVSFYMIHVRLRVFVGRRTPLLPAVAMGSTKRSKRPEIRSCVCGAGAGRGKPYPQPAENPLIRAR